MNPPNLEELNRKLGKDAFKQKLRRKKLKYTGKELDYLFQHHELAKHY
jgi:hypothetical protein